jgi:hypothetical protein
VRLPTAAELGTELAAQAAIGEVNANLDGSLFARSFMGSLVSFGLLKGPLGMERVPAVDSDRFLNELVGPYVRGTVLDPIRK